MRRTRTEPMAKITPAAVRDLANRAERLRRLYGEVVADLGDAEKALARAADLALADDPIASEVTEGCGSLEAAAAEARREAAWYGMAARETGALARKVRRVLEAVEVEAPPRGEEAIHA